MAGQQIAQQDGGGPAPLDATDTPADLDDLRQQVLDTNKLDDGNGSPRR